jgi:hypothetical protein
LIELKKFRGEANGLDTEWIQIFLYGPQSFEKKNYVCPWSFRFTIKVPCMMLISVLILSIADYLDVVIDFDVNDRDADFDGIAKVCTLK